MFRFFRKRLNAKLAVIWLAVVIALAVVLVGTFVVWYRAQVALVEQERRGYAQSVAGEFELLLARIRYDLRASGADIAGAAPGSADPEAELRRLARSHPAAHVAFVDDAGRVVASSDPGLEGSSLSGHEAFEAAMRAPEGFGIEPSEEGSGDLVGFHVAQAIPSGRARPSGVMMMFVDVRELHRRFPVEVPFGGISVVDSDGQVVFQNENPRLGPTRARWGDESPFWRRALEGRTAITRAYRFPEGGTRIGAFVPIGSVGWAAGSSVDPQAALAPFYRTLAIGSSLAALVGFAALLVSVTTARRIRRSVVELADEARRIGSGELEEPVRTGREDEIGDAARSLEAARAELLGARQRADEELLTTQALLHAADALAFPLELDAVLETVARLFAEVSGRRRVSVDLLDASGEELTVVHVLGEPDVPRGTRLPRDLLPSQVFEQLAGGGPVVVDVEALPLSEESDSFLGRLAVRYALAVPLVAYGRVLGLVGIDDPGERVEFDLRTMRVTEGIGPQAALAIENARRFEQQTRGREFAETLDEINRLLHASLESTETVQKALLMAGARLGAAAGAVFLADGEVAAARYHYGFPDVFAGSRYASQLFPFAKLMVESKEPVAIGEPQLPELMNAELAERFGVRSLLAIPLLTRGEVVGGIGLVFAEPHEFVPAEADFARKFGASVSLALENARLYESERERARAGRSMAEINAELASSLDIEETLPVVLSQACRELGAFGSTVADRVEGGWRIRHVCGMEGKGLRRGSVFGDVDAPALTRIARAREPYVVSDVGAAGDVDGQLAERFGYRAYAAYPLIVRGEITGALSVFFTEPRSLSDEQLDYLRRVAFAVSLAEESSRLYEAERESARLKESLSTIDHSIHGSLSTDEMLQRVVVDAAEALGCESSVLDLREDGHWVVRYVYRFPEEAVGRSFTDDEIPFAAVASRMQRPVVIDDSLTDSRVDPAVQRAYKVRSVMVAPLIVRDQVIGAQFFNYHDRQHTFSEAEIDFARRLASSLGLALTNARLFEAEHHIAETLQTALLALPESIPGVDFAHLYRSATEAARVGGDFYDLFEIEHRRIGIVIGDIAGHGVDAAVLTSLVKNAIRVRAVQRDGSPDQVVETTSRILYDNSPEDVFATVFFGVLDLDDGLLEYCGAGHTTGASIRSGGGARRLSTNSPLIGAFPKMRFTLSTEHLDVHDLLFLYTDGLTEARRGDELFGEERLFELLSGEHGGDPARTTGRVFDEVLAFSGGELSDDLAILAVQRSAPSGGTA